MDRRPDVVEFYVTTITKHVVDVNAYAAAVAEQGDGWLARAAAAVKHEIPEDRETPVLTAVALYAEGEFITEYDVDVPGVYEEDDRNAIVIAAEAAGVTIPDGFGMPGREDDSAYHRLFDAQPSADWSTKARPVSA